MTIKDICDTVQEHLNKLGINVCVYFADWDSFEDFIEFEISWGDWKHDHLRAERAVLDVVSEIPGFVNCSEGVTEEDGSDCYSAVHRFFFNKDRLRQEPIVMELGTI